MDLILWRHADAGEAADARDDAATDDLQRALTPKGERQAKRMAEWLNRFLPDSTRILVSPALRTQQTAQALGRKFQTRPDLGPQGTVSALLSLSRWPERREPVLVVGHQPTLGLTAALLMGGVDMIHDNLPQMNLHDAPAWSVRKGAAWWLRHRVRDGVGEVVLVSVRSPETL